MIFIKDFKEWLQAKASDFYLYTLQHHKKDPITHKLDREELAAWVARFEDFLKSFPEENFKDFIKRR